MTKEITFKVSGDPRPKGSVTAFCANWPRTHAKVILLCRNLIAGCKWYPKCVVTPAAKGLKPWEKKVAVAAQAAMAAEPQPWEEGVIVIIEFFIKRPQAHYGTGKNKLIMKDFAKKLLCIKKPDIDKISRAVNDAMTGIVYRDDAQVVCEAHVKKYGKHPGIKVRCRPVSLPEEIPEPEQLTLDLL